MAEHSIKVLLVDESILSFNKYNTVAEQLGISLERYTCWDNARDALYKDFKNWSAIVLEPNSKLHAGGNKNIRQFLVHALSDILAISTQNNKIIPWYIFTDREPEDFVDLILEGRQKFDADWPAPYYVKGEDAQMLFKRVKIHANQAKSLQLKNHLYPEVFKDIDYLERYGLNYEVGIFIEDLLLSLHYDYLQENNFKKLRLCIEHIFKSMHNNGLIPYIPGKGGMQNVYASCQVATIGSWYDRNTSINYQCDVIIDNLLKDLIVMMINVSNADLHAQNENTQNDRYYKLVEYQDKVGSNYLLHSFALQLCDVIKYYAYILRIKK